MLFYILKLTCLASNNQRKERSESSLACKKECLKVWNGDGMCKNCYGEDDEGGKKLSRDLTLVNNFFAKTNFRVKRDRQ